jgi:ParB-like chromosome segregation protein Spo0J
MKKKSSQPEAIEVLEEIKFFATIVDVDKLQLSDKNPRTIKDDAFKRLVASLVANPILLQVLPIIYEEDFVVIGGNQRVRAIRDIGWTKVPAIDASLLTDAQMKALVLLHNSHFGDWQFEKLLLSYDFEELDAAGIDIPTKLFEGEEEEQEDKGALNLTIVCESKSQREELVFELESRGLTIK